MVASLLPTHMAIKVMGSNLATSNGIVLQYIWGAHTHTNTHTPELFPLREEVVPLTGKPRGALGEEQQKSLIIFVRWGT